METWVREKGDRNLRLRYTDDAFPVLDLIVGRMEPGGGLLRYSFTIDAIGPTAKIHAERAIKLLEDAPAGLRYPLSQDHKDWLYHWPSHRIERSHTLMLHMLETDMPWTGRYLSNE